MREVSRIKRLAQLEVELMEADLLIRREQVKQEKIRTQLLRRELFAAGPELLGKDENQNTT